MAEGATLMTSTSFTSRILGTAWPGYMNKVVAETMYENIKRVGLPKWSEDDIALAKATQRELGVPEIGLSTEIPPLQGRDHIPDEEKRGGPSDDIGDVSWSVPTVVLRFPSNFQAGPGHNWANGIAMATPIAHKGATAAAKVQALTILDLLLKPAIVQRAWDYFRSTQTKDTSYTSFLSAGDKPPLWLNKKTMDQFRPEMRKYYYDASKYKTYLDQLGIKYPTIRTPH
jgi:aminobenzoyl-glutamate utilization protein B